MMQTGSLKFKTIVVATDLSYTASCALPYAQAIARLHHAKLVVVHVIDPVSYAFPKGTASFEEADRAARDELQKIEQETRLLGIPIHSVMESGVVCERILQALNDNDADLLVLGTRSRTQVGRAALGTIARQLLARAHCPILTVSLDAVASIPWAGQWRHVVAAVDFSPVSVSALLCAHQMANKQLIVVHASRCHNEKECSSCRERLRFLAPLNESHTVPVEHISTSGDAAKVIAEYARKFHADLIVLGSPVNELAEGDLHTSTVLQVISRVACPVLCVPLVEVSSPVELIREVVFA
jgi:nucleotide-binding universal stress UspA family protein